MKTLTASNERVQFYITYGERCSKKAKEQRMELLKETLLKENRFASELFPNKQAIMLDKILYDTSGNGICKIGAETLAKYAEASPSTVTNFNKSLKATGQFIIARLKNSKTNFGKLIYVDMLHPNFEDIMKVVFELNAVQIAERVAGQKSSETVEAVSVEDDNKRSNLDISIKSKQEKDMYISDNEINAIREEIESEQVPSREYVEQYRTNDYQIAFYDVLTLLDYNPSINAVKHVLALRIGSNCDAKRFYEAKNAIHSIAMQINAGVQINNVVAAFTAILDKRMTYNVPEPQAEPTTSKRPVPFYDWLKERE